MKDNEWLQIVQNIVRQSKRQTIPLENVGLILDYQGYVEDSDVATKGQAVAALLRHLLADEEIQQYIRLVQQHKQLYAVIDVVDDRAFPQNPLLVQTLGGITTTQRRCLC